MKQLVQANIDEDIEAPHYWPFVREPPLTDGFSSQGASYVENALMALCRYDKKNTLENMEWDKSIVTGFRQWHEELVPNKFFLVPNDKFY